MKKEVMTLKEKSIWEGLEREKDVIILYLKNKIIFKKRISKNLEEGVSHCSTELDFGTIATLICH